MSTIKPGEVDGAARELRRRARYFRDTALRLPGIDGRGRVGAECLMREAEALDRVAEWMSGICQLNGGRAVAK